MFPLFPLGSKQNGTRTREHLLGSIRPATGRALEELHEGEGLMGSRRARGFRGKRKGGSFEWGPVFFGGRDGSGVLSGRLPLSSGGDAESEVRGPKLDPRPDPLQLLLREYLAAFVCGQQCEVVAEAPPPGP